MPTIRPDEAAAMRNWRRRRLIPIIDAGFQWKYTIIVMLLGTCTAAIMGGLWYRAYLANTRLLDLAGNTRLQDQVERADGQQLLYLVGTIAALAISLGLWGLVVTHRISGPVYLVARYCDVLTKGHYPDIRPLRRHDELQAFFTAFCSAVAALRQRDLNALHATESTLERLRGQAQSTDVALLQESLQLAISALEEQRHSLGRALGADEGIRVE